MASRLTDEELRKSLREFGENVGPITPTTRSTLERRLGALRRARGHPNALSSDDSEIEGAPSGAQRKKRTLKTDLRRTPNSAPSSPESDIFKKPAAVNVPIRASHRTLSGGGGGRKPKKTRNSTFEVETSDSEFETPELQRRPLTSLHTPPPLGIFRRHNNSEAPPGLNSHHFTPTLERLKKAPPSNGFLPREGEEQGRSTEYSHCISWLLLAVGAAFFVLIGLLYMSGVQRNTPTRNYTKFCGDVTEDQCKPLILVSRELHYLLTTVAGDYECGFTNTRNMSVPEARSAMLDLVSADSNFKMEQFDEIFNHSLLLFIKNPNWGVKCFSGGGEEEASREVELSGGGAKKAVRTLEAEQGAKSLWCRGRLALALTLTKLLVVAAVCVLIGASYLGWSLWRRRREAQEKLFYEMVERVIDVLREPSPEESGNCKAVVNVRDALIPAKERRSCQWVWERVVRFIEENESRVSVEFHKIHGEDFKVWRWNTPAENEGGKQGKVWQGQAFSSPGKGKSVPYTPTPCLKIRNMFDPEVEYGNDWQVSVRDAILEKCEGNDGIIHIAFDTATNNEGCVFMMCNSSEAAGKAYNDLHGWWFDGKLVTAKYLKRSRYMERFPDSAHLPSNRPLRPSNDRRLSLAAPFFSSALERS